MTTAPETDRWDSYEALVAGVAALLEVDPAELSPEAPLTDWGLDSLRLMALVDAWYAAGHELDFADLAEEPTLRTFSDLLGLDPSARPGS